MTWMIETGRFPVVPKVSEYLDEDGSHFVFKERDFLLPEDMPGRSKKYLMPPPVMTINVARGCPPPAHILVSTSFLISPAALETLERIQPKGWEAFPVRIQPVGDARREHLVSDTYHLMRAKAVEGAIDLERSILEYERTETLGHFFEHHRVTSKKRLFAVRVDRISDLHLWRSDNWHFYKVHFVSDTLKQAWCDMGMNPEAFEPCLEV